jgi:hypothetical protein
LARANLSNAPHAGPRRRLERLFALSLAAMVGVVGLGIVRDRSQALVVARQNALSIADGVQVHATELLRQSISSLRNIEFGLSQIATGPSSALPLLQSTARIDTVRASGQRGGHRPPLLESAGRGARAGRLRHGKQRVRTA